MSGGLIVEFALKLSEIESFGYRDPDAGFLLCSRFVHRRNACLDIGKVAVWRLRSDCQQMRFRRAVKERRKYRRSD
jgi:hypothetical protein